MSLIPGQGVLLSRYPITSDEYWRIHFGQQQVTLLLGENDITLYNAHAAFPFVPNGFQHRHEEIMDILERAKSRQHQSLFPVTLI